MKKPTLEQIKEHFKDAKTVKSTFTGDIRKITGFFMEVDDIGESWHAKTIDDSDIEIWNENDGFAEIITTKDKDVKKLIGYKLKYEKYRKAARAITNEDFSQIDGYDYSVPSIINDLKEAGVLDLWFTPVYEEEVKLEVGKWYKVEWKKDGDIDIFYADSIANGRVYFNGNWFRNNDTDPDSEDSTDIKFFLTDKRIIFSEATDKEVETALIAEAKRRGFKFELYFNPIEDDLNGCINPIIKGKVGSHFDLKNGKFYTKGYGRWCIFKDGKWAEIKTNTTIKLNSEYSAEIKDGHVIVGCQEITFKSIKKLYKAIKNQ